MCLEPLLETIYSLNCKGIFHYVFLHGNYRTSKNYAYKFDNSIPNTEIDVLEFATFLHVEKLLEQKLRT